MKGGNKFLIFTSFDDSKILIGYRRNPLNRDDNINHDLLGFFVFDSHFEKVWGDEIKMPHTEAEMNNLAFTVGSDGTGYLLSYLNKAKSFELIKITENGEVSTYELNLNGDFMFQSFYITENTDGNLSCAGFYANGLDYKFSWSGGGALSFNTNGILHFETTTEGDVYKIKDYEFPLELINQNQSQRSQNKNAKREAEGKAGIPDVKLREIETFEDGSALVIGEQYYQRTEYTGNGNKVFFYYQDVIALKVDAQGEVKWLKRLPKLQNGVKGRGGNGVKYMRGNGAHYFIYLDNKKNLNLSVNDVPEKHQDGQGGILTSYKIDDATGSVEKHALFDVRSVKGKELFQFKTSRIFIADEGIFLVEAYMKGKQDSMIKIEVLN